ncbi:MAG TPA: response regulator [Acidimicrobiales bacterium]|nr:response regulator [Acidimicrobiales bacterium]
MAQVLVIDDDPRVLRYATLLLQFEGHCVRTESTYADGLAAMGEGTFDVVVVDVRLGATSGLELLAAARRAGLLRGVHVVLHTSEPWDEICCDADRLGLAAFVPKPAEPRSLVHAVTRRPSLVA